MSYIARINVGSGGRTGGVGDSREGRGALAGTCARARRIEGGDSAVLSANVAVSYITGVSHIPRDIPRSVHAVGACALAGTCARARSFIRSEGVVGRAHEAVKHIVRVNIPS